MVFGDLSWDIETRYSRTQYIHVALRVVKESPNDEKWEAGVKGQLAQLLRIPRITSASWVPLELKAIPVVSS